MASIRLQAEMINLNATEKNKTGPVPKFAKRLMDGVFQLENQMEKILHMGKLEVGKTNVNKTTLDLSLILPYIIRKIDPQFHITYSSPIPTSTVMADEQLLEVIFRNLLENTKIHNKLSCAEIDFQKDKNGLIVSYFDDGHYSGNWQKLGELFYSPTPGKGTGLGIYLIKNLMKKMNGTLAIKRRNHGLNFQLTFPRSKE